MIKITFKEMLVEENCEFFKLYKFTCSLPKEQAFMLSYLIDADDFVQVRLKKDTGYFQCTNDFIKGSLNGWSDAEINNALQKLEFKGLIFTKKISLKGEIYMQPRFIKLNIDNINQLKCAEILDVESDIVFLDKEN